MTQHPSRPFRRRSRGFGLAVLSTLALAASAFSGSAAAAPGSGHVALDLTAKSGNSLLAQGVKLTYSAKAGKTGATKRATASHAGHDHGKPSREKAGSPRTVTLPVVGVDLLEAATLRTAGGLRLTSGKRVARLRNLTVQSASGQTAVSAQLGKRRIVVFRAQGGATIGKSSVSLEKAPLSLTAAGADAIGKRLGLDGIAAGKQGTLSIDARLLLAETPKTDQPKKDPEPKPLIDPYSAQCDLELTKEVSGAAGDPADAPTLSSPASVSAGKVDWGFSGDFRYYVVEISGGSLVPVAPAEVLNPPLPAPQIGSFRFPADTGSYAINDPAVDSDDQALVEGEGEVVLCNSPHGFRVTLSNPTVTLDGVDSRLTVDVDTNMSGIHTPTQRVDLATLDPDGIKPFYNENAKTLAWQGVPATLTADGEAALQLCNPNAPGPCDYEEGDPIDPVTFSASTATEVSWPFASGCTVGSPATASSWPATPAAPAALPALTAPEQISSGSVKWGLRNSLRATVKANGVFNLSGATASDPSDMSGAGKFFTWPSVSGEYEAGTPGKLILRGTGTVGLCNTAHGYGTVLSSPTLVIDGAKSRLTMDVSSRLGVSWTSGRVDIATLAVSGVEKTTTPGPGPGEETITWAFPDPGADNAPGGGDDDTDSANSSVKLSESGGAALSLINLKTPGTSLNKVSVSIVHPDPTP